jgi:hypothetical protein
MQMAMKINLTTPYSRSFVRGKPSRLGRLGRFNGFPRYFDLSEQVDELVCDKISSKTSTTESGYLQVQKPSNDQQQDENGAFQTNQLCLQ